MNLTTAQRNQVKNDWLVEVSTFPQVVRTVNAGGNTTINITCYECPVVGARYFSRCGENKWQYRPTVNGKRERWVSTGVPFIMDGLDDLTASHKCHNPPCHNPLHLVYEDLETNKSRNGCPGPNGGCRHQPVCLMAGPYHNSPNGGHTTNTGVVVFNS